MQFKSFVPWNVKKIRIKKTVIAPIRAVRKVYVVNVLLITVSWGNYLHVTFLTMLNAPTTDQ
jgi:hypothetical protein